MKKFCCCFIGSMISSIFLYLCCVCLVPENQEEKAKRRLIEEALKDPSTTVEKWREFAKSEYGLINGELHHNVDTARIIISMYF